MKKFNKIFVSIVSLNMVVSMGNGMLVLAEDTDDTVGTPVTSEPTPVTSEPTPVTSEPTPVTTEPNPNPNPYPNPYPNPTPTYPTNPTPTEPSEEGVEITVEETEAESSEEELVEVNISDLVAGSLENPAFNKAYTDYQYVTANYMFEDSLPVEGAEITASQLDEVQSDFESYLSESLTAEDLEVEVETTPVIEEKSEAKVLNYHYYYKGEKGNQDKIVLTLQLIFNNDQLKSVAMLNYVPIISNTLSEDTVSQIKASELSYEDFVSLQPVIEGLVHSVSGGTNIETVIVPGGSKEDPKHEFVNLTSGALTHGGTSSAKDSKAILGDIWNYLFDQEMAVGTTSDSKKKVNLL